MSPAAVTVPGAADFVRSIDGDCVAVTSAESASVTTAPTGGVPLAVAVFATEPASISACDTEYDAEHVVDAPGANDTTGHVTADRPGNGSATPTDGQRHVARVRHHERVRHRVTRRRHRRGTADFTIEIEGSGTTVTVVVSVSVTAAPTGGVPLAAAVLTIEPESTSACVTE